MSKRQIFHILAIDERRYFMKIIVDSSMKELGVDSVVIGIAHNVDPNAPFTDAFKEKLKKTEEWALNVDVKDVKQQPFVLGYREMIKKSGRSVKKNPPTLPAFVKNIQHRGHMPRINTIVDIYNVESLNSFLAIGGHDLDKIDDYVKFTVNGVEDTFLPICADEKAVDPTDFVYRDSKGIIAWLGIRDSEHYKFDDNTRNAFFAIQGNGVTSVEDRIAALERIRDDLKACMPDLTFEIMVVEAE